MVKQPMTPQELIDLANERLKGKGITPTSDAVDAFLMGIEYATQTTMERIKERYVEGGVCDKPHGA